MPRDGGKTRSRILKAGYELFYKRGFARVSMDAIAAASGVTKRSLYYHFESKDDLVRAVLQEQQAHAMSLFEGWGQHPAAAPAEFLANLFAELERWARTPRWRGSGYSRITMELADLPGHPARKAAREHKRAVEGWLTGKLQELGARQPARLARETVLLLEGSMSLVLIHGETSYVAAAGEAASRLAKASGP
jgi:AcrR family transcriptional regulator